MVVADVDSGESEDSEVRTSSGMFLTKRQVRAVEFYYVFLLYSTSLIH